MEEIRTESTSLLADITSITYITFITTWQRAGKKNPELLTRGREADFLKGSKAR